MMSEEDFVAWMEKNTSEKMPSKEEWEVIRAKLKEASLWRFPWYNNSDGGDDGGGESQVPHTSISWEKRGNRNIPVIH